MKVQRLGLQIFVSYSVEDSSTVQTIEKHLEPYSVIRYWGKSKEAGREVWPSIYSWINASDIVLVVLTGATLKRAISVGNEVGYARKAGKHIIPLVSPEVPQGALGCLNGVVHITLDPTNPVTTLEAVKKEVIKHTIRKAERAKAIAVLGMAALALIAVCGD